MHVRSELVFWVVHSDCVMTSTIHIVNTSCIFLHQVCVGLLKQYDQEETPSGIIIF